MTVDITQEEMDILNLNGISKDTVRNNVQYMRATGMTDEQIRQDFTNTISTLRPVTKLYHNTTGKITEWENSGGITPYELAKKKAVVYTGNYNNIDENANLNWFEKKLKNSSYNDTVDNRIKTQEQKILERNKRVNNGTASFLDRAGAAIDRMGKASYQAQTERPVIEPVALEAGVDLNSGKVIDNRDKSKPIGFGEALADSFMTGSWLPYVGGYLSKADVQKQREIQKHILNGEPIRPDEKAYLDRKLEEIQERNVRGYTLGGKISEGFLPSLIRFGGEMATGGAILEGLGLVNKAAEGASFGQKALTAGSNMLKTGAVNTVLPFGWNDTYENYQSRRFDKELDFTDEGHAIFQEAEEKPATSFLKSVGQTFVMFSSEASGELLGLPLKGAAASAEKYIGNPLYKYLSQNKQLSKFVEKTIPALSKAYEKINHLPIKGKNVDWLMSKVKFDGLLEEMGEEVVEDVLNLTLGTGDEKRTLDNYINAIFKSPDEWAVTAGVVALQGMSLSAASHIIGSHMAKNGATGEEIKEVMENTTESDKKEIVEQILQSGTVDLSNFYPEDKQRAEEIKDDIYNKLVNANVNTQEANDAAIMVSSFFERYGTKNEESREKFNEFINNLAIKYNIPVEERNSLVYNQPAENKFDRKNIESAFGDTVENIQETVKADVLNILEENNIDSSEFNFEDIRIFGSYSTGKNKKGSDLDLLVQYSGSMREDDAFNMLNDNKLSIYDKNGKKIKIDINPINTATSGTIDEHLNYLNQLEPKFQAISSAGAKNNEIKLAQKEWQEKGTGSKYFKKWFGNSKVVDENGKPLVVYHGTNADFDKFEIGDVGYHFGNYEQANERMTDFPDGNPHIMSGYLKMENPLDIVSDVGDWLDVDTVKEYLHEYEVLSDEEFKKVNTLSQITSLLQSKGYDGIIYENQFEGKGKSYIVFNSSQFKAVNNRGTFDDSNPNIYYQSAKSNIVDWSDKFTGEETTDLRNVRNYINKIIKNGNKFATSNKDWFIDIKKENSNRKQKRIKNKLANEQNYQKLDKAGQIRHNKYVLELEELIKNAEYAPPPKEVNSNKKNRKSFIEKYHYFKVNIKVGKTIYEIILDTEQYKGESEEKPQTVHLYNIQEKSSGTYADYAYLKKPDDNNSITDNADNFNPDVNNHEDRNLVMAHAAKSAHINDIIESGSLIAPSFSITARESEVLDEGKFGDVLFIRNPKKINYQTDNIYDRDIYSPRMPMPSYDIPDGRVVDYYEYDSLKRNYENNPERFVEKWGETFDEMFKGAKKVLFLGYTPSGNRRYVPYTNENVLKEMSKQGVVAKEGFDYGLSSLLARFSNKQSNKQNLKEAAKKGLGSDKDLSQKWEDIKKEYDDLGDKVAEYYWDKYSFYEIQSEAFYYIAKNKMSALKKEFDMKELPPELIKEVKNFVEKASTLPRSYFEAKPMKEVSLSEFKHALVKKGTLTDEQIKGLNDYGIKVTEYEKGELNNTLENLDKAEGNVYFQPAYHGTPHRFDNFSTEHIGTGEGAQAHGWGLYFAGNKDISENYRQSLSSSVMTYKGKNIPEYKADLFESIYQNGKKAILDIVQYRIDSTKLSLEKIEADSKYYGKNNTKDKYKQTQKELKLFEKEYKEIQNIDEKQIEYKKGGQLFEVDIPENDELLDEDKKFSEQPEKVQKALRELAEEYESLNDEFKYDQTGEAIYKYLAYHAGSPQDASMELNEVGIKGITYDGHTDGRCYVIFDDKAINILKTYYQENNSDDEKLIAGFSYQEVMDKLLSLYDEIGNLGNSPKEKATAEKLLVKAQVLEDAFDYAENPDKFANENKRHETMLNAYYIMNNQELPNDYVEAESGSKRTYDDLKAIYDRKKEERETEYLGYFYKEANTKPIVTIMASHNSSTALHEFGHMFLELLNELAKVNTDAREQLEAVNKWLGSNGEYTSAQHEKFANNFVAYLYKGKAPNSKLKSVFEDFKKWLKSVYDHILDIPDVEISEEVQELFDNIFGNDSFYQERKEANELLKKVKKNSIKERLNNLEDTNSTKLDDVQKEHKEAAYKILSIATGKSIKYLKSIFETTSTKHGLEKKRENVYNLIEQVGDKFTSLEGFQHEWIKFFNDTGVSYDNQDINGDYELAMQAFDVIINRAYRNPAKEFENELSQRAEYFDRIINNAQREYKQLIQAYKTGNRNVALSAIYDWLDSLDNEIKEDYENKFIYDSGIIERDENIDKFAKAKRQILSKAMELENKLSINKNEKYQEMVKEIMKELDFLQPSDKAKLTANVLDVPSTEFLMSSIDNIMDIAKTMEDMNLRRKLANEIHKEIQQTKNIKKNGRTVGKYDYKSNKLFEELRRIDRMSAEAANDLRLSNEHFATAEDNGLSFGDKLINRFLSYKSAGKMFADTELLKSLYDDIIKIKLAGKYAKSELDLQEKLSEEKDIEELINIVQNKKDAKGVLKTYVNVVGNLESTLNALFNKDIKEKYGSEILYAETQSQAWQYEQKTKFETEVAKIYNLPQWLWDKKILDYLSEKHTYPELRRKYDAEGNIVKTRTIDRTLSKMDIIQAYIWSKNEVLEKRLINQFGEDVLYSMFDEMSLEDVKLAELMMDIAQSFYPLVNKAFINKYGLDLPKVSCYFPSTPERGSEVDLYNEYSSKSLNNSFTKSRAMSETQPMDFHNPVAILYNHIDGVAKFAFMSDSLDKANLRFKNNDLKRVIVNKYGEDAYRTLEQILMNVTYKKEAPVFNGMNKIIDNMVGNWIQANVAVKPIVGLKQLLSANNYAVDMPYMTWQKGFLKALAHPKETIDYMMNIPYIKARYQGNFSNEFLKQQIENSAFAASKKLKDACTLFIKMGDIGAIIFGGKPYIDYQIKEKGLSEAEAVKNFIISTNRSQQSSAVSSLSNFQVAMTRNPMGKLFIAFKNSPQQYIRMCGDAIVSCANGDMTKTQCAKYLFQFGYLQPFLYAVATSGSLLTFLFSGDDDDLLNDLKLSIFNLGSDALPILGDIYKYAINHLVFKNGYTPQTTPLLGDIENEINRISKEDVTLKDYLESIGYMTLHVGLGYNSKAIMNSVSGAGDILKGDITKGAMRVFGYTEKRAKRITGND